MCEVIHSLLRWLCHQLPERSPQFEGAVFPLCYRCAGLQAGLLAGYLWLVVSGGWRRQPSELRTAVISALPTAFFVLDAWACGLRLWDSPGWLRALAGLSAGVALPFLVLPLAAPPRRDAKPALRHPAALLWPAAAGAAFLWLLEHPGSRIVFDALALVIPFGLLFLLANILLAVLQCGHGGGGAKWGQTFLRAGHRYW